MITANTRMAGWRRTMKLNLRVVLPGTGFEAASPPWALPSLTVVALALEPDAGLARPVYKTGALPVELIRH